MEPFAPEALQPLQLVSMLATPGEIEKVALAELAVVRTAPQPASASSSGKAATSRRTGVRRRLFGLAVGDNKWDLSGIHAPWQHGRGVAVHKYGTKLPRKVASGAMKFNP
jgi:hypothetical protein